MNCRMPSRKSTNPLAPHRPRWLWQDGQLLGGLPQRLLGGGQRIGEQLFEVCSMERFLVTASAHSRMTVIIVPSTGGRWRRRRARWPLDRFAESLGRQHPFVVADLFAHAVKELGEDEP